MLINIFPEEIWNYIFITLDVETLNILHLICKDFKELVEDNYHKYFINNISLHIKDYYKDIIINRDFILNHGKYLINENDIKKLYNG